MPEPWRGFESIDWAQVCAESELIARGPLNYTYRVELDGTPYIVRHRRKHVGAYGQTFAGERHLPDRLRRLLRVPALLKVAPDSRGRDAFAIFELIETSPIRHGVDPSELLEILTTIHDIQGSAMGDLGRPFQRVAAEAFLSRLIRDEVRHLEAAPPASAIRKVEQQVLRATACFKGEPPCLCHGDVHTGNFLRRRDGRISVIDWEAVRYRVAAADFNQLHDRWLSSAADLATMRAYAERQGRDFDVFARQVAILRFLWHLRTFNFYVRVQREPSAQHERHLEAALAQVEGV
jgi:aminoglycoside phosphotransferase (APT) family kinase protein